MSMFQHFDWAVAVLGLGSNVGDRMGHLQSAVDALDKHRDIDVLGVSPVYETEPVGGPDQGQYLNAVVKIATLLDPRDLLALAHELEDARGRERTEHWGPRTLDVDLVTFTGFLVQTEALTLPHPLAHERAFVLAPWYDLDPDAELPGKGAVRALLQQVPRSGVQRRDDRHLLFVGAGDTGVVTSTRIRLLVGIAVVVGVLTWAVLRVLDAWRGGFPSIGWATPATLALCAAGLFGTLIAVRPRLLRRPGTKPIPPLLAARFAVLALACSRAGAAFAGAYTGFALALSGEWDTSYGRERAIYAAISVVASLALVVAALLLERACRLPDDDVGADGGLGSAA